MAKPLAPRSLLLLASSVVCVVIAGLVLSGCDRIQSALIERQAKRLAAGDLLPPRRGSRRGHHSEQRRTEHDERSLAHATCRGGGAETVNGFLPRRRS